MTEHAGVVRDQDGLREGLSDLDETRRVNLVWSGPGQMTPRTA